MKLILHDSHFITRVNIKDKRLNDYLVRDSSGSYYISSDEVRSLISCGKIKNAYLSKKGGIIAKTYKINTITSENVETFKNFVKLLIQKNKSEFMDYYDEDEYYLSNLLESDLNSLDNTNFISYGKEIVAFCYLDNTMFDGITTVYVNWEKNTYYRNSIIRYISKYMENKNRICIFSVSNYSSGINGLFKMGYTQLSTLSNIGLEDVYNYTTLGDNFYIGLEKYKNILVSSVESKYPDTVNITELNFKNIRNIKKSDFAKEKMKQYSKGNIISWYNSNHHVNLIGFHYFSLAELVDSDKDYLLCFYKGILVGAIKYGVWGEGVNKHQAISFIDVHQKYRNLGIAKAMIKQLDSIIYDKLPLVITDESELGSKCHMADKMKQVIKKVTVKTYHEAIASGSYY